MTNLPSTNWNYPTAIKAGPGRLRELPQHCAPLGISRPLLVTDPGLADLPMVERAVSACRDAGLPCTVFSAIKGNPTGANVEAGVEAYRSGSHDGVIALGGGSALDAAKAVALMAGQALPLWDFEDVGDNYVRVNTQGMAPVIAIPTTAGTGSEVGRASVITDESTHVKRIIFHPAMLPALVILDAELCTGLPPRLTAATGMDALSHNMEALCSPVYHPMAQGIALEGIHLIHNYLPRAFADGNDIEARHHMLVASCMGATAFQKGLGAMHALAHPLGALYDAHHGTLNAILMPYVLQANRRAIQAPIQLLSRYLGLGAPPGHFDDVMAWVLALRESLGIPHTLREIGIPDTDVALIGNMAVADGSAATNPIRFSTEEYAAILRDALNGTLQRG
ncbi:iron-containing alcohol dehydrogenase [Allopusillimonas soli]|uniref:Iron-containing alcohol dehydrogenase n=1 Tax=Allopusillimonas soli TaxID=659016 RepID=A0A853F6G3_9BURK|nr:iron-containing alcohol dehydrogenase [Allopusillimonas soli]NYT35428.1 iron-containing alcohol dehydrogenase [Allopusillimonas soli]TEA75843.1 iron-containing alcohol dehydrogenase [Allopusillimonas soli]